MVYLIARLVKNPGPEDQAFYLGINYQHADCLSKDIYSEPSLKKSFVA